MLDASVRARNPRSLLYAVGLLLLPLLLLALNSSWVYPSTGTIDPWFYSGYHVHFQQLWRDFPSAYYGSRVPWTVLGWAVHRVAGSEVSLYALALLLYYAATCSIYYAIYILFRNAAAAFLASALMGTNSWFLLSIGWNYVDGPSIACISLALAAVVEAAIGTHWRKATLIWGAATAATIALYPMNAVLVPVQVIMFAAFDRLAYRRPPIATIGLWVTGFATATLAMSAANWALGAPFDFMRPTFAAMANLMPAAARDIYYAPWHVWLPNAPWMLLPALTFIASIAAVSPRLTSVWKQLRGSAVGGLIAPDTCFVIVAVGFIVTLCGLAFMQSLRWCMLSYFFRANVLWPFLFMSIGGFLTLAGSRHRNNRDATIVLLGAAICLTPWGLGAANLFQSPLPSSGFPWYTPLILSGVANEATCTIAGALLLWAVLWIPRRAYLLAPLTFFSALSILTLRSDLGIRVPQDFADRDRTLATFDAAQRIDGTARGHLAFWWATQDPAQLLFRSLGSMYLQISPQPIEPGDDTIILSSIGYLPEPLFATLRARHLVLKSILQRRIQHNATAFDVTLDHVGLASEYFNKVRVPLSVLRPATPASGERIDVVTPSKAWAYGASFQIPSEIKRLPAVAVFVRVELRVQNGGVGVGITTNDGSQWVAHSVVYASAARRDAYLSIPRLKDTGQLVFFNDGEDVPGRATVDAIDVFYAK